MKRLLFKRAAVALVVAMGLLAGANAFGGSILYNDLLFNPSFEIGGGLGVCPASWTCTGVPGPNSYSPTDLEYVAGADGLPGLETTPDGSMVASSPIGGEGSGTLSQTNLGTYVAGNTYTLNLWIGTPLVVPSQTGTAAGPVGIIEIEFLGNGGATLSTLNATPSATPGQWTFQQFSFTPTGSQLKQTIGLAIEEQPSPGSVNINRIADFDIESSAVPEPASVALLAFGLVGPGLVSGKLKIVRSAQPANRDSLH